MANPPVYSGGYFIALEWPGPKRSNASSHSRFGRQRDTDQSGGRGDDFEFAVVGLDDFLADGQSQAKAYVAGGIKRGGNLARRLGGEPAASVLHLNGHGAVGAAPNRLKFDSDLRALGIGLKGVEQDLGQRVFQGGAVPGN